MITRGLCMKTHIFEVSLLVIPMWSVIPTKYCSRFFPSCPPESTLKLITADLNVQHPSSTSIQWAVIPRKPWLIVSAVQASTVTDILPGADCVNECGKSYIPLQYVWHSMHLEGSFQFLKLLDKLIMNMGIHIMSSWQLRAFHVGSHNHKAVSECCLVCNCKWLWPGISISTYQVIEYLCAHTWSSHITNCAMACTMVAQVNSPDLVTLSNTPLSFCWTWTGFPFFFASISFHTLWSIAQWCSKMSVFLHFWLYTS